MGNDRIRIRRWRVGPPWPSSEANARASVHLGQTVVETTAYVYAGELVRKALEEESTEGEYGSDDGGWARLGAVVRKTPAYGYAVGGLKKASAGGVRKVPEHEATE
ncbi:hypothetical protein Y032_0430g1313 [Ancylostoma ceylanicum]|nr:hypothetical protein Y032_0430g1313 [Ancylostoma ceylanicum]